MFYFKVKTSAGIWGPNHIQTITRAKDTGTEKGENPEADTYLSRHLILTKEAPKSYRERELISVNDIRPIRYSNGKTYNSTSTLYYTRNSILGRLYT